MKSKIVKSEIGKRKFPLIAKSKTDGAIVLFRDSGSGTYLIKGNMPKSNDIGYYSDILFYCFDAEKWEIIDSITITFES